MLRIFKTYTPFVERIQHKLTAWLSLSVSRRRTVYWSLSSHWVVTMVKSKRPSKKSPNFGEIQSKVSIKKAKAIFCKCRNLLVKWNLDLPKWASRTSGIQCIHHALKDLYRCLKDSVWKPDQQQTWIEQLCYWSRMQDKVLFPNMQLENAWAV